MVFKPLQERDVQFWRVHFQCNFHAFWSYFPIVLQPLQERYVQFRCLQNEDNENSIFEVFWPYFSIVFHPLQERDVHFCRVNFQCNFDVFWSYFLWFYSHCKRVTCNFVVFNMKTTKMQFLMFFDSIFRWVFSHCKSGTCNFGGRILNAILTFFHSIFSMFFQPLQERDVQFWRVYFQWNFDVFLIRSIFRWFSAIAR